MPHEHAPRSRSYAAGKRARRTRAAPHGPRTVKGYSVPGEGRSTLISVVTVVALFALWWVATHYGWIRDIFLPTPERIVTSFADAWKGDIQGGKPLLEHFWCEPVPRVRRVPARVRHRDSGRHRDGRVAHRARHLRSADRVLPAAAAARVPAADRHLVRHRRDREGRADLPRLLRAARDGGARRRAQRDDRADQRRVLDGRVEVAGDLARDHPGGDARDPHRHAHRDRLRLDDARRRRDGRGDRRASARWCSTRRTSCAPTS